MQNVTDNDIAILEIVKRLRFVTADHVAYWHSVTMKSARRSLQFLEEKNLIIVLRSHKPFVYRLAKNGSKFVSAEYQLRWHSAPAIHQYLMANTAEIHFKQNLDPSFQVISPKVAYSKGLNVAVAEHFIRLNNENCLLILDDYSMRPKRITHILNKTHNTDNNRIYLASIAAGKAAKKVTWNNAVKRVFIVTTEASRKRYIETYLNDNPLEVPFSITVLKPIWRIA